MRAFIQLLSAAAIARLLTPEDMGIFAVASAAIAISTAMAEFGITPYLIQVDDLGRKTVQKAFGIIVLINWFFAAILFFGRGAIGDFYGNAAIVDVIAILSLNFLLNPFGTIGIALIIRERRFGPLTIINVASGAASAITSVALAFYGLGPMALALGAVVMKLGLIIGILICKPRHLSFRPRFRGSREIIGFGSWGLGANLIESIGNQSPELIIGRSLGFDAAGLFDRGMALTRLVNQQIAGSLSAVLTPFFAQERRDKIDLKSRFLERLQITSGLMWPLMMIMSASSSSLMLFLFGPQWTAAGPVAGILAISFTLHMPFSIGRQLILSYGRMRQMFFIETNMQISQIVAVVAAVHYGLLAITAALILPALVFVILSTRDVMAILDLRLEDVLRSLLPSLLLSLWVGSVMGGLVMLYGYAPPGSSLLNLMLFGCIGMAAWLSGLWLCRHPLRHEIKNMLQALQKKLIKNDN